MAPEVDGFRSFDALFGGAPMGVAVFDGSGYVLWANRAFSTLLRMPTPVVGRNLRELPGLHQRRIREAFESAVRHGRTATLRSVGLPPKDGAPGAFVDLSMSRAIPPIPPRVLLTATDVTDRVAEQERAILFHESFLSSTNAIEVTDRDGVLVDVNPAFERIYGYARSECVGRRPNIVRSRVTPPQVYERMWADLLAPDRGYWSGELMNRDRLGRERPVFLTVTAIRDPAGVTTHYLGVAVDLTEQKIWERRAAQSDKLASIGQLAAGVAHEINTPLANVMLVAESIRRRTQDPWTRTRLDTVTEQLELAAKIVRGLLDFARQSEPHMNRIDLSAIVRDAVAFLKGKQSANVEIEESYPKEPVPVLGDRVHLIQVITNVLNNAYEAMEGGGKIRVAVAKKDYVAEVEISDTGPGIPPEALPHIFEPFFTTKPEGKGTGLGLAISQGIVQAHGGRIVARNLPDGGAIFLVSLPAEGNPEGAIREAPAEPRPRSGGESAAPGGSP